METVFVVPWIEVEFGQRPEGWNVYLDEEHCKQDTRRASNLADYPGGYYGPERPLHYFEVPVMCLPEATQLALDLAAKTQVFCLDQDWSPVFKSIPRYF